MLILVDYDNIYKPILARGIFYVIGRILSKIQPTEVSSNRHVTIRLYGGWYEDRHLTQRAQDLAIDVTTHYPNTHLLSDNHTKVIVNCEIAYSILADPSNHLFSTYRVRGIPSGLRARHPSNCNCSDSNCPIIATYDFLRNDICTRCHVIKPDEVFYRSEQKLVDTMLTSDLIFCSNRIENLGIVSSDDDFWPGIKTTLVSGKKIIQIHTRHRYMPIFYTNTTNNNYVQREL